MMKIVLGSDSEYSVHHLYCGESLPYRNNPSLPATNLELTLVMDGSGEKPVASLFNLYLLQCNSRDYLSKVNQYSSWQ